MGVGISQYLVPTGQSGNVQKDILDIIQRSPVSCARAWGPLFGGGGKFDLCWGVVCCAFLLLIREFCVLLY